MKHNKVKFLLLLLLFSSSVSAGKYGNKVKNGIWTSSFQKIEEIHSYNSYTEYKIQEATACGGNKNHYWQLSNRPSSVNNVTDYKHSMLLAAFIAGKKVKFQCYGSQINHFIIK